uniref:Uncharacterized protein n=1 Tax=Chromera velia CCMP2878 TaxID=1169474 RepID=A0A0G4HF84_9ALVE|eukprot:Cvel_6585.t1-p1 / transcript=Cvel_6585.t1 / gene=Cvel_6585 / organism=Chromera_velia_CCMP2878 / gene_product=hypothetical protein / transcript_product=hypothetical protein / location=Cvel_scaffold325:15861-21743(-) / protein_length=711 / sequence_SO=supercontig / SO=protein_coding / is_pseudo=false
MVLSAKGIEFESMDAHLSVRKTFLHFCLRSDREVYLRAARRSYSSHSPSSPAKAAAGVAQIEEPSDFEEGPAGGAGKLRRLQSSPCLPVSLKFSCTGALVSPSDDGEKGRNGSFLSDLPTIGSLWHSPGNCGGQKCFWARTKRGCKRGWLCNCCHFCVSKPSTAPSKHRQASGKKGAQERKEKEKKDSSDFGSVKYQQDWQFPVEHREETEGVLEKTLSFVFGYPEGIAENMQGDRGDNVTLAGNPPRLPLCTKSASSPSYHHANHAAWEVSRETDDLTCHTHEGAESSSMGVFAGNSGIIQGRDCSWRSARPPVPQNSHAEAIRAITHPNPPPHVEGACLFPSPHYSALPFQNHLPPQLSPPPRHPPQRFLSAGEKRRLVTAGEGESGEQHRSTSVGSARVFRGSHERLDAKEHRASATDWLSSETDRAGRDEKGGPSTSSTATPSTDAPDEMRLQLHGGIRECLTEIRVGTGTETAPETMEEGEGFRLFPPSSQYSCCFPPIPLSSSEWRPPFPAWFNHPLLFQQQQQPETFPLLPTPPPWHHRHSLASPEAKPAPSLVPVLVSGGLQEASAAAAASSSTNAVAPPRRLSSPSYGRRGGRWGAVGRGSSRFLIHDHHAQQQPVTVSVDGSASGPLPLSLSSAPKVTAATERTTRLEKMKRLLLSNPGGLLIKHRFIMRLRSRDVNTMKSFLQEPEKVLRSSMQIQTIDR